MTFEQLRQRLLADMRGRVRSGRVTERGLARRCGISQPHMHNILKGVRKLSVAAADQVLLGLQCSLLDLFPSPEPRIPGTFRGCVVAPVLDGRLGPGHPFPGPEGSEQYPLAPALAAQLRDPVVCRLSADESLADLFGEGDLALLERDPARVDETAYCAVAAGAEGRVRRLVSCAGRWRPEAGGELAGRVVGRVVSIIRLYPCGAGDCNNPVRMEK